MQNGSKELGRQGPGTLLTFLFAQLTCGDGMTSGLPGKQASKGASLIPGEQAWKTAMTRPQ